MSVQIFYAVNICSGLDGRELIFFVAAGMVVCFRSVTKTMLIPHSNVLAVAEQCLHSIKATFVSRSSPQFGGLCTRGWEGADDTNETGQMTQINLLSWKAPARIIEHNKLITG